MTATMKTREFRDLGYLIEINRRILHPHGLALSVYLTEEPTVKLLITDEERRLLSQLFDLGREQGLDVDKLEQDVLSAQAETIHFGDVVDNRSDPEGMYFGDLDGHDRDRIQAIEDDLIERSSAREAALGFVIEPLPHR